jgi:transcriptional regulator with XRE-family HTH domain
MNGLGNKEIMSKNIKFYMDKIGKDRNQVCKDLGFKYSTFTDWINGNKYPRIDKIELMANYFGIQKSDLIEEKNNSNTILPSLTPKDEREIAKDLEAMLNSLDSKNGMAAYNDPEDEEDRELLKASLLTSMRLAKQIAKKKYTPKKHHKE